MHGEGFPLYSMGGGGQTCDSTSRLVPPDPAGALMMRFGFSRGGVRGGVAGVADPGRHGEGTVPAWRAGLGDVLCTAARGSSRLLRDVGSHTGRDVDADAADPGAGPGVLLRPRLSPARGLGSWGPPACLGCRDGTGSSAERATRESRAGGSEERSVQVTRAEEAGAVAAGESPGVGSAPYGDTMRGAETEVAAEGSRGSPGVTAGGSDRAPPMRREVKVMGEVHDAKVLSPSSAAGEARDVAVNVPVRSMSCNRRSISWTCHKGMPGYMVSATALGHSISLKPARNSLSRQLICPALPPPKNRGLVPTPPPPKGKLEPLVCSLFETQSPCGTSNPKVAPRANRAGLGLSYDHRTGRS